MATASGGEQIVNILSITQSSIGSTTYTVPSGRYAKIDVLFAEGGGRIELDLSIIIIAPVDVKSSREFLGISGQVFQIISGGVGSKIILNIREFANP